MALNNNHKDKYWEAKSEGMCKVQLIYCGHWALMGFCQNLNGWKLRSHASEVFLTEMYSPGLFAFSC